MPETVDFKGRTVALDFDGVLHSYTSGWTGPVPTDPPVSGAQEFCRRLLEANAQLVVYTTRAETMQGVAATEQWLNEYAFPPMLVTYEKPKAIAYVDDRAVSFRGDWNNAWAEVLRLRTQPNIEQSVPFSYHDLHITTPDIERTSIFDLPYGIEVTCTRVGGWQVWNMNLVNDGGGRIKPSMGVQIAGEYHDEWLVLDVAGQVILDSRNQPHDESKDEADGATD